MPGDVPSSREPSRLAGSGALRFALLVAVGAVIVSSVYQVGPSPDRLLAGAPRMANLVGRMLPPDVTPSFLSRVAGQLLETLQIAIAGTFIGIVLSLPVAWLSARGVTPFPKLAVVLKGLVSFFRTVPDLVWALVFVATVGLGAVAGTMTIIVDTIGFCGRFFCESMEEADKKPQEALAATGASRIGVLFAAILPDTLPSLTNSALFSLEKAVRASVVLGIVGAGGIGQELQVAFDLFQYQKASTIIIVIFCVVLVMEVATNKLRRMLA